MATDTPRYRCPKCNGTRIKKMATCFRWLNLPHGRNLEHDMDMNHLITMCVDCDFDGEDSDFYVKGDSQ